MTATNFVDCSSNNGIPNVAAYAAAGHKHLCRKVSEGVGYRWFEGDLVAAQAHAHGMTVGNYHWLRPDSSARAQADFFVASVRGSLKPGDWLMTDFERTSGVSDHSDAYRATQLHDFNTRVRELLPGYYLCVYTGNWYLAGHTAMQTECRRWDVVMSDYSGSDVLPNPYGLRYVAWQFTDRARVTGFGSPVDYNRWLITPGVRPSPTFNLLEWIMSLPGTPAGLTYQRLVADIAAAVHNLPVDLTGNKINGRPAEDAPLHTVLKAIHEYAGNGYVAAAKAAAK